MDVTLKLTGASGEYDVSQRLSTYRVTQEVQYERVIVTMDGVEHPFPGYKRNIITFSMFPMTDDEASELYAVLSELTFDVSYTNTCTGADETERFRVVSNMENAFLLMSVDGKRRYKGTEIQLRALGVA